MSEDSMATSQDAKLRLGGMALRNGLLVHGPTHWAAAVRTPSGEIEIAAGRKPRMTGRVEGIPGARGVVRLGEAMLVIPLVKKKLPAAQLPFQNPQVLGSMAGAAVVGSLLRRRVGGLLGDALLAAVSLAPSLLALRGGDLAAYHGVEHKAIAAYEHDGEADARDAAKEHDRWARISWRRCSPRISRAPRCCAGSWSARPPHTAPRSRWPRSAWPWRSSPGPSGTPPARPRVRCGCPATSCSASSGTREPTETQLEVSRAALEEILRVEGAAAA